MDGLHIGTLNLIASNITELGVQNVVSSNTGFVHLNLRLSLHIADQTVHHITEKLTSLRTIDLTCRDRLTDNSIDNLYTHHPSTVISTAL